MLGNKQPCQWHEVAWRAAMSINCQVNDSVGFTPYYLFYGKHPEYLGSNSIRSNVEIDKNWASDLKLAKNLADSKRESVSSNYKYPTYSPGDRIFIRPDNSKNAKSLNGIIVEDSGGATALIKLDNRSRPLPFHKGMIFVKKLSNAWKRLHKTDRDFTDIQRNHYNTKDEIKHDEHEPISRRLRRR